MFAGRCNKGASRRETVGAGESQNVKSNPARGAELLPPKCRYRNLEVIPNAGEGKGEVGVD
jgi:hypothetical protein